MRQCNFSRWHPGTAIDAQNVLGLVFVLLIELGEGAAEPVVYVRTIEAVPWGLAEREPFDP